MADDAQAWAMHPPATGHTDFQSPSSRARLDTPGCAGSFYARRDQSKTHRLAHSRAPYGQWSKHVGGGNNEPTFNELLDCTFNMNHLH